MPSLAYRQHYHELDLHSSESGQQPGIGEKIGQNMIVHALFLKKRIVHALR